MKKSETDHCICAFVPEGPFTKERKWKSIKVSLLNSFYPHFFLLGEIK